MDTSFIFHPTTHHLPMPACPRSLPLFTSYLQQQLHRVAPSWALPLSPPLRPSFLLSLSDSVVSIARGNRDSLLPFLRRLFLFVSPIFHLLPQRLHSALPLYLSASLLLFALYSHSLLLLLLLRLNRPNISAIIPAGFAFVFFI